MIARVFSSARLILLLCLAGLLFLVTLPATHRTIASLHLVSVFFAPAQVGMSETAGASPYLKGMLARRDQPGKAEGYFEDALRTSQAPIAANQLLGMWSRRGDWQRVIAYLQSPAPVESYPLLLFAIHRLPYASEPEISDWKRILQARQSKALLIYAQQLCEEGQCAQAEQWASSNTNPVWQDAALSIVGRSLFYQQKYVQAQVTFEQLYRSNHQDAEIAYWYGRSLLYAGKPQQAIAPLERATQLETGAISPWYLHELGSAYLAVGRCRDAQAVTDLAFQRRPDDQIAERLEALRATLANCKTP